MNSSPPPQEAETNPLLILLQLESMARQVQELAAMPFLMVNETRRLLNYRQAVLFRSADATNRTSQVLAISSISLVDRNVPMVQWLEKIISLLYQADGDNTARTYSIDDIPHDDLKADWQEFSLAHIAWAPLYAPSGLFLGALWLARETPWNPHELVLLTRLCEAYAHAWQALPASTGNAIIKKPIIRYLLLGLLCSLLIPVRLSALAPVEIIAEKPYAITSPLDAVIAELAVDPNQTVKAGQVLFRFEDTVLRKDFEVAERNLAVAKAEHLRAMQAAFADDKNKAEMALLKAKAELAEAEQHYARDVLDKVEVPAPGDGVAVFRDVADWLGKPVKTGEKIMEIANPERLALRINLPVKEAIALQNGAEVTAFFDADPLHPLDALVTDAAYQAEVVHGDLLAYRVDARLTEQDRPKNLRIGWQGTAKIYGDRVPLLFYLLRRPVSAVRQYIGF